ncbi:MAG: Tyrocidine synthase 3 [Luteibacter sp.]|uniref:non-ribosomal peptide synthetase n=1 Tax=Luteibacter sp. TaxID=1886636 RepID=UPI001385AA45|nr:non-ribosomal peptide synthetase [Luteibacter sp.]KAF1007336.1 MAG: Tyrocidine synthase 3 [Luteibacter sp.]
MTPQELAAATAVDYDPFAGSPLARLTPTTAAQREVWLASRLEPEASLAYNEAIAITFKGHLDIGALEMALHGLVERHEALRATFASDGEGMFVAGHGGLPLARHDLSLLAPFECETRLRQAWSRIVTTPFDLEHGPMVRAELFHLGDDHHILTIAAHHIVCDGWSFGVIVRDLAALYAQRLGQGTGPAPAGAFSNFALAEATYVGTEAAREDERYWLDRYAGAAPVLDLPTDRSRPRRRTFASRREDRTIDAAELAAIRQLGASQGASLYATLLTGFAVLLRRLTGQDDIVIGIPTAGQAAEGEDTLVGHAVNVLPLRAGVTDAASFASLLGQVRRDLLDAFDHQRVTLGELLGKLSLPRDPSRLPLVCVLFNLDAKLDESTARFPGLAFDVEAIPREHENFELFVNAVQLGDGLRLECQYNADIFEGATVQGWLDAYVTLLRHAARDAAMPAVTLPVVSDAVYRELAAMQPAPTPFPELRLAHEFFEQQVDRAPQRAAVRHADASLSYAQLESRANRIGNALRARGVGHGSLVGLCLARGTDMLAAVLGTLKSGAGYVPLDPSFPADRLAFMASDANLAALVTDDASPLPFAFDSARTLALDSTEVATAPDARPERDRRAGTPDSVAYVIFTSGSTGRPKGVRVPHRAAANFLTAMQRIPGIAPDDRLVAVTTLSFDIAFMEMLLPLTSGAEVVIAGRDDVRDGAQLRRLVENSDATVMQATPAGWRLLVEAGWHGRPAFRAISGGEPLPVDLAEALLDRCGEVWNGYGPTETTVYSTYWRVSDPREGIYIGRPVANTTVHILDEHGNHCPLGVAGEIHIGGAGVTLGYLERPELTAERFVVDPWSETPDSRMYRTGDRGRWLANGLIEHLGRLDFQVKVRGYRIEPGEIECVLTDAPEVARAVVMAREDRPGDVRLVAYLVTHDGATLDEDALRAHLRTRLPDYMLPQHLVVLDALPLLPNGKTDRKALPAPMGHSAATADERIAPRNDTERRVAAAMEAVLSLPGLDVRDDFFALGGHSLLASQLTARLNREFNIALSFRTLFDAPSIERLAATIDAQAGSGATAPDPIGHRDTQDRAPLSLMQRRLWALEKMHPGRVTYNAPSAHRLHGRLDEAAFDMAFQALIQRQPSLRTTFEDRGDELAQVVRPQLDYRLFPAEDLSLFAPAEREARLMDRLRQLTDTPFDLGAAPLFSARMFRLADDEHVLFFMPHHIIWDGWSFDIFYNELSALYRAFANGQPSPLAALPVTYGDFAAWHAHWLQTPAFHCQLERWRERLATMGDIRPLPTDHPRRPGMSGLGRTEWIHVDRATTDALHEVARQAEATLNMTLLALYFAMLSSSAGQRDLVVGTPVRGRNHTEVESVMGYFNNLLPLHVHVDPALSFVEFVRKVKAVAIEAFGQPDVPLEYLQRELRIGHGTGATLYQALFSFQDARQRNVDWGGLSHEQILLFQSGATEDMGLWFLENHAGMVGGVTYNADLLRADTAQLMRDRYLAMVQAVIRDPSLVVGRLTAATDAELDRVRQWHATTAIDASHPVPRIDEHADAALIQRSHRFAQALAERGAGIGSVVGICLDEGTERLAAWLGVLRLGGTVLMLDPADPAVWQREVLTDAHATLLIGDRSLESLLDWPNDCAVWRDTSLPEGHARFDMPPARTPALAYYAIDADGRPAGASLSHAALTLIVDDLCRTPSRSPAGAVGAASPLAAIRSLTALVAGGEVDTGLLPALPLRNERPMPGSELWIVDEDGEPCPIGAVGTIMLKGDLTPRPFGARASALPERYRTDQPARWLADGRVQLLERDDRVLRRHGVSFPLAAIETSLLALPGVVRAVAVARDETVDAWFVVAPGVRHDADGVRAALAGCLPAWAMPTHLTGMDAFPLLPEGDIDLDALPSPSLVRTENTVDDAPASDSERLLASVWQELLGMPRVRTSDNFFDVGGHSLLAVEMAQCLQKLTGVQMNLLDIANGTLGTLAADLALARPAPPPVKRSGLLGRLFGRG